MSFDKEMMKALEADGEKLRQLTGEDHGPHFMCGHIWAIQDEIGLPFCAECGEPWRVEFNHIFRNEEDYPRQIDLVISAGEWISILKALTPFRTGVGPLIPGDPRLKQLDCNEIPFLDPLPRCIHGSCLIDGGGEILEPPCGCTLHDGAKYGASDGD
jgi:hypothetical protein